MLDTNLHWYCLVPCEYPDNYWRLTQHTFSDEWDYDDDSYRVTTTNICEGTRDSIINKFKGELDIFFPETKEEPLFASRS